MPSRERERQIYTKDCKVVAAEFNRFFSSVRRNAAEAAVKLATSNHINCNGVPSLSVFSIDDLLILNLCTAKVRRIKLMPGL